MPVLRKKSTRTRERQAGVERANYWSYVGCGRHSDVSNVDIDSVSSLFSTRSSLSKLFIKRNRTTACCTWVCARARVSVQVHNTWLRLKPPNIAMWVYWMHYEQVYITAGICVSVCIWLCWKERVRQYVHLCGCFAVF